MTYPAIKSTPYPPPERGKGVLYTQWIQMERSSFLFAVNALLTVMAEVMLDLLERAATRLRHELVDEGEAEKADGREDEERSREANE